MEPSWKQAILNAIEIVAIVVMCVALVAMVVGWFSDGAKFAELQ